MLFICTSCLKNIKAKKILNFRRGWVKGVSQPILHKTSVYDLQRCHTKLNADNIIMHELDNNCKKQHHEKSSIFFINYG